VVGIAAGVTAAVAGAVLAAIELTAVIAGLRAPTPATPDLPSEWGGGAGVSGAR
jgi:hypothetical protein